MKAVDERKRDHQTEPFRQELYNATLKISDPKDQNPLLTVQVFQVGLNGNQY